jgi:hypothetical protein
LRRRRTGRGSSRAARTRFPVELMNDMNWRVENAGVTT